MKNRKKPLRERGFYIVLWSILVLPVSGYMLFLIILFGSYFFYQTDSMQGMPQDHGLMVWGIISGVFMVPFFMGLLRFHPIIRSRDLERERHRDRYISKDW